MDFLQKKINGTLAKPPSAIGRIAITLLIWIYAPTIVIRFLFVEEYNILIYPGCKKYVWR